jgi:hypothetical protein
VAKSRNNAPRQPVRHHSGFGPLIFSGGSSGSRRGDRSGSTVTSTPFTNVLMAGNMCASTQLVAASAAAPRPRACPLVLFISSSPALLPRERVTSCCATSADLYDEELVHKKLHELCIRLQADSLRDIVFYMRGSMCNPELHK